MVLLVAQSDSFGSIYSQLSDYVRRQYPTGDDDFQVAVMLEPVEVAQFACPGVQLSALLSIASDQDFVIAARIDDLHSGGSVIVGSTLHYSVTDHATIPMTHRMKNTVGNITECRRRDFDPARTRIGRTR